MPSLLHLFATYSVCQSPAWVKFHCLMLRHSAWLTCFRVLCCSPPPDGFQPKMPYPVEIDFFPFCKAVHERIPEQSHALQCRLFGCAPFPCTLSANSFLLIVTFCFPMICFSFSRLFFQCLTGIPWLFKVRW
jgi:hypothetical protein